MAQVGVVFAILTRTGLDAITLTLEVEQAACQLAFVDEGFIGLAIFRAHHVLSRGCHAGGEQRRNHGGTQRGALEDHFFHLLLLLILWT
ncbi:hypothetical protein D3C78_1079750 [compost metagenome]